MTPGNSFRVTGPMGHSTCKNQLKSLWLTLIQEESPMNTKIDVFRKLICSASP